VDEESLGRLPAINQHGGYGRWAFIEITDPWDAKDTIWAELQHRVKEDS
jgi:type III restriction enzyme